MDKYRLADSEVVATGVAESVLMLTAPAGRRPRVIGISAACIDYTSADGVFTIKLRKATTAGTSSAATPIPTDEASPASDVTGAKDFTAEPTKTTDLFVRTVPMQALFEFYFPEDEFIIPASGRVVAEITHSAGANRTFQVELMFR